ncbi:hypothetical protein PInf_017032 [Phytophthora infestans]|nr:hypothetical protein PInf_017032 [Phytophthora infestans]
MHWSMEVYDYERRTITDTAVGGIDLRKGCWIHCKWCNSTLQTTAFSLKSWEMHQTRKTHLLRGQRLLGECSQPQFVTCSQSSIHTSTSSQPGTPMSLLELQPSQEIESLMLVRRDLHLNKQHQARYERDVTNVINAMTSLVSDQHKDLDTLQLQVHDMTREVAGLKKQVEGLRHKKQVRTPQKEIARPISRRNPDSHVSSVRSYTNEGRFRVPKKATITKKPKPRRTMTEMDIFEKRFRLT